MKALAPIYVAYLVLAPIALGRAAMLWWKSKQRFEAPKWRSRLALVAFSLGGLSLVLWYALMIRGLVGEGRFYDAIPFDGLGSCSGLVGFLASFPARGKLRWPACIVSAAMTVIWVLPA